MAPYIVTGVTRNLAFERFEVAATVRASAIGISSIVVTPSRLRWSIIAGEQYSTVFKDTRTLAGVTVKMVDAILSGGEPEINDTSTYDNGVKVVPSYLLEPVSVNLSNYEEVLVGSGYYTADQLK